MSVRGTIISLLGTLGLAVPDVSGRGETMEAYHGADRCAWVRVDDVGLDGPAAPRSMSADVGVLYAGHVPALAQAMLWADVRALRSALLVPDAFAGALAVFDGGDAATSRVRGAITTRFERAARGIGEASGFAADAVAALHAALSPTPDGCDRFTLRPTLVEVSDEVVTTTTPLDVRLDPDAGHTWRDAVSSIATTLDIAGFVSLVDAHIRDRGQHIDRAFYIDITAVDEAAVERRGDTLVARLPFRIRGGTA